MLANSRSTTSGACPRSAPLFPELLQQAPENRLQRLPVETILVLEVVVDQGAVDPGDLGDLPDGNSVESLVCEEIPAGVKDALSRVPGSWLLVWTSCCSVLFASLVMLSPDLINRSIKSLLYYNPTDFLEQQ